MGLDIKTRGPIQSLIVLLVWFEFDLNIKIIQPKLFGLV